MAEVSDYLDETQVPFLEDCTAAGLGSAA